MVKTKQQPIWFLSGYDYLSQPIFKHIIPFLQQTMINPHCIYVNTANGRKYNDQWQNFDEELIIPQYSGKNMSKWQMVLKMVNLKKEIADILNTSPPILIILVGEGFVERLIYRLAKKQQIPIFLVQCCNLDQYVYTSCNCIARKIRLVCDKLLGIPIEKKKKRSHGDYMPLGIKLLWDMQLEVKGIYIKNLFFNVLKITSTREVILIALQPIKEIDVLYSFPVMTDYEMLFVTFPEEQFVIRFHPRETLIQEYKFLEEKYSNVKISTKQSLGDDLSQAKVCISIQSTCNIIAHESGIASIAYIPIPLKKNVLEDISQSAHSLEELIILVRKICNVV